MQREKFIYGQSTTTIRRYEGLSRLLTMHKPWMNHFSFFPITVNFMIYTYYTYTYYTGFLNPLLTCCFAILHVRWYIYIQSALRVFDCVRRWVCIWRCSLKCDELICGETAFSHRLRHISLYVVSSIARACVEKDRCSILLSSQC